MSAKDQKLDNPVWYSLTETHQDVAIVYDDVKFYQPDYCPFGGSAAVNNTPKSLSQYSKLATNFYVVGHKPHFTEDLELSKELVCNQMILDAPVSVEIKEEIVVLQFQHKDELLRLVNLVQPGYFRKKTSQLGRYYGIFQNQELVAVSGERIKMSSYTEVSAVVTHPNHVKKGFAKQLVAHTANQIFRENKMPYLHVAETNIGAISMYEKLGFKTRRKISFWNLVLTQQ